MPLNHVDFDQAERLLCTGQKEWHQAQKALAFSIHAFTIPELKALFDANGLQVVRVLGKSVCFRRLQSEVQEQILADEELTRHPVELECRYADDPGWAGSGGPTEVTGVKTWTR